MREYKVTYETVGRGTSFVEAETEEDARMYAVDRFGPVIAIEMLPMTRHEAGELWSEALHGGRFYTHAIARMDAGRRYAEAEAQERFIGAVVERHAEGLL